MKRSLLFAAFCLLPVPAARAFDYTPTPISKALAAHDLVLVAKVRERTGKNVLVEPVSVIKGKAQATLLLPDTWRPGTELLHGPVRFEAGKTYLLMLHSAPRGGYILSKDFAAPAGNLVTSPKDALVRAVVVLHSLSQRENTGERKQVLANAWNDEADDTKEKLLWEFFHNPPDTATVPFLVRAMNAGRDRSSLMEASAHVSQKHKYKEAIPDLLAILEKRGWESLYPAKTLGILKVREAYEPIMALIEDPKIGNIPYLMEALIDLEDKRAAPLLIKTFRQAIPGLDAPKDSQLTWWREHEIALRGLARVPAPEAVDSLLEMLNLNDYARMTTHERGSTVWTLTVEALGAIGPPARRAAPRIRQLLQEKLVPEDAANEALKRIEK